MTDAAARWADELASWALPEHIVDAAAATPWVFPPDMFTAPAPGIGPPSRSTVIAGEALRDGGTVLDVGCGGGAAAFALQTNRSPFWKHFWALHRPEGPTAWTAAEALRDAGLPVRTERSAATERDGGRASTVETAFWCRQLCLPPEREPEVAALVAELPFPRQRVTLWWDV